MAVHEARMRLCLALWHGFSRAIKARPSKGALAPEVRLAVHSEAPVRRARHRSKRQRRALYQPGATPQENSRARRRFRSAEGPSEGEPGSPASLLAGVERPRKTSRAAGASALPKAQAKAKPKRLNGPLPPRHNLTPETACPREIPRNLVKPPNHLNQTKQREKSLHINSTQLAIIEIERKRPKKKVHTDQRIRPPESAIANYTFQGTSSQVQWNQIFAADLCVT